MMTVSPVRQKSGWESFIATSREQRGEQILKFYSEKINQIFLTSECQNVLSSSPNNWDLILGIEGGQMLITGECEANSKL